MSALPPWTSIETALEGVFERHYFTNNGPAVRDFETTAQPLLGGAQVIALANETLGFMALVRALGLRGSVVLPALAPAWLYDALWWSNVQAIPVDVTAQTHRPAPERYEASMKGDTTAIVACDLWGVPADRARLEELAARTGTALLFDASHSMAHALDADFASRGTAVLFSLAPSSFGGAIEGAFVTTRDEGLADALRTARSFTGPAPAGCLRINAKMTEIQAAFARDLMDRLLTLRRAAERRRATTDAAFAGVRDVRFFGAAENALGRDMLLECERPDEWRASFAAEGIDAVGPLEIGVEAAPQAPNAGQIIERLLLLRLPLTFDDLTVRRVTGAIRRVRS